jgi:hypothetical protein
MAENAKQYKHDGNIIHIFLYKPNRLISHKSNSKWKGKKFKKLGFVVTKHASEMLLCPVKQYEET